MNALTLENLISDKSVLNIYVFGTHLYGCASENSDVDYIVITSDDLLDRENIKCGKHDFNLYSEKTWVEKCKNNHINALEVISISDAKFIIKETVRFDVIINPIKLRQSISATVSNSWAKANKKLNVEKDYSPILAKKSLWHCFRILLYGIQVAEFGRIVDFNTANYLYEEIINSDETNWKFFKNKYQEPLNNLRTKFRTYMESEWEEFKKEYGYQK
jgi:predicted nucleotidyltransferase